MGGLRGERLTSIPQPWRPHRERKSPKLLGNRPRGGRDRPQRRVGRVSASLSRLAVPSLVRAESMPAPSQRPSPSRTAPSFRSSHLGAAEQIPRKSRHSKDGSRRQTNGWRWRARGHLPGPRVPSAGGISRHRPVPPLQRYPFAFYVLPKRHGTVARAMPLLATAHDGA